MAEKKQRKPTSTDVAELAGVSQTSVSLVLSGSSRATFSEQTRARVFEAARQLGYQPPAHRTRKKNGNDRRLILVLTPTLANQYYSELIQTLEDYAGSQEFRVLVCNTFRKRELEKYYLEQFSDNRISGIVYTFLPSFPDEAVRLSARIPLVLIGEKREELPICSIELSNQRAGAMLADHLYSLGHRHAAFISTPMDQTTLARKQRLEGLRQRFHERGRQDGVETSVEALVAPDSREEDGVGGSVPFEYATGARLARELLAREHGQITMIDFMASEEDICAILRSPLSCVISDATYPTEGQLHPRVCGNVTHLLEHFVREKKALSWEQAVHKLTGRPAQVLGLTGKGRLEAGCDADVCMFAPEALHERATYTEPQQTSQGMSLVLVAGEIALENGKPTGICAGRAVRR